VPIAVSSGVVLISALFVLELAAIAAAAYFGYLWASSPTPEHEPLFVVAAIVPLLVIQFIQRRLPSPGVDPEKLAEFMREGQALRGRLDEDPLPIQEHNDWVDRMNAYFRKHPGRGYETRLSDFTGMTFYAGINVPRERRKMSKSLDGRTRRLHEFISELGPSETGYAPKWWRTVEEVLSAIILYVGLPGAVLIIVLWAIGELNPG